jgi:hypothetical protein
MFRHGGGTPNRSTGSELQHSAAANNTKIEDEEKDDGRQREIKQSMGVCNNDNGRDDWVMGDG